MCFYLSKSEDQCLAAMKQVAKGELDNELEHFNTMKNILQVCRSKREFPVQKALYHVLLELYLHNVFPSFYFVNTN